MLKDHKSLVLLKGTILTKLFIFQTDRKINTHISLSYNCQFKSTRFISSFDNQAFMTHMHKTKQYIVNHNQNNKLEDFTEYSRCHLFFLEYSESIM